MERCKIKMTNCKQFERMVSLMGKNVELAKGYFTFASSKAEYHEAWLDIAKQLNRLGPPLREGTGWQKVWSDFKNKIKKKLEHNKRESSVVGDGSSKLYIFSSLEESVISMLCLEKTCSASIKQKTSSINSVRSDQQHSTSNNNKNNPYEQPSIDQNNIKIEVTTPTPPHESQSGEETEENSIPPPSSSYRKRSLSTNYQEEKMQLLECQTINIEEQTKYLKECAIYARKSFEIQEKKLKMWHENETDKRKISQQNIDYKVKSLEYKERKQKILEDSLVLLRLTVMSRTLPPSSLSENPL